MAGKIIYKVHLNYNLIIVSFQGEIGVPELIQFMLTAGADEDYKAGLPIVLDYRLSKFTLAEPENQAIIEALKDTPQEKLERKMAFLTSTPKQAADSILFNMTKISPVLKSETFTTVEALYNWIGVTGLSHKDLEVLIDDNSFSKNVIAVCILASTVAISIVTFN